jgi:hypothetical protein
LNKLFRKSISPCVGVRLKPFEPGKNYQILPSAKFLLVHWGVSLVPTLTRAALMSILLPFFNKTSTALPFFPILVVVDKTLSPNCTPP